MFLDFSPDHVALVRPAPRRMRPVDLKSEPTTSRIDVGAQNIQTTGRHHTRDLTVEPVHIFRANDELA